MTATERRTKRRYAHEMYPHAEEGQTRPLAAEVPYLYARFVGFEVFGTGWGEVEPRALAGDRVNYLIATARTALLADALAQGMTGDEAWAWADKRVTDDLEIAHERAAHYGVPFDRIKPYPCGPEPDHHYHDGEPIGPGGWRESVRVDSSESACDECTEPIEVKPCRCANGSTSPRSNTTHGHSD